MNGILCVNKPQGMTSFDVIKKARGILKAKIGHSGTLDPMASGVLILAVNQATKALPYLGVEDKTYVATVRLGAQTDTGDVWGKTLQEKRVEHPFTEARIQKAFAALQGPQRQRVPKVSAKKIAGRRSYDYVFNNEEVETLYTDIVIHHLEMMTYDADSLTFKAHVSSGTYIRTLCEDIAQSMQELGHMSALQRVACGHYTLEDCVALDDITQETPLKDVKEAIALPHIIGPEYDLLISHGKRLVLDISEDRVLVDGGVHFAVYEREKDTVFKAVRGLW